MHRVEARLHKERPRSGSGRFDEAAGTICNAERELRIRLLAAATLPACQRSIQGGCVGAGRCVVPRDPIALAVPSVGGREVVVAHVPLAKVRRRVSRLAQDARNGRLRRIYPRPVPRITVTKVDVPLWRLPDKQAAARRAAER